MSFQHLGYFVLRCAVQSWVCKGRVGFMASKPASQWMRVTLWPIATVAMKQSAAVGEIPCFLRRAAWSHAWSHQVGSKGKRVIGANQPRRVSLRSLVRRPVISSKTTQSVRAVSPFVMSGLRRDQMIRLPAATEKVSGTFSFFQIRKTRYVKQDRFLTPPF